LFTQGHLEAASTDETIGQLQRMREHDTERIAKLNAEKAELGAALKGAEARIASEAAAAQRAAKEAGQRQYAMQTQVRCRNARGLRVWGACVGRQGGMVLRVK
jgi:peptidoglycan hydrolase CwlO-like protein